MGATLTARPDGFEERDALAAFARDGLTPGRWSSAPGDTYAPHSHSYHKVLYCLRGSITFRLEATGEALELRAGDRLDIEPATVHSALVGPAGVVCIEAPRRPGGPAGE